ncbi:MAG: response regulator, partial [Lachnospiraceae bacterium]|nr:response regulator [Lachnospiraceae bacterium]
MIKVLLVDDNRFALEYFSHLIPWETYGFTLSGTALDGEFALAQFKKDRPQIVITDIQMPNINGIELARQITQIAPDTVIIFLSSYEEFQYAKAALQLGVYDYILKHEMTEEKLTQKLLDAAALIKGNEQRQRYINEGNLLYLLNDSENADPDKSRQIFRQYTGRYDLCILMQDHIFPVFQELAATPDTEVPENSVRSYLYQYQNVNAAVRICEFTWVILSENSGSLYETAATLSSRFYVKFRTTASIVLVAENRILRNCFTDYYTIRQQLTRKYFYLPASVLNGDCFFPGHTAKTPVQTKELRKLSENQDFEEISQRLQADLRTAMLLKDDQMFSELTRTALEILLPQHMNLLTADAQSLFELSDTDRKTYWYDAVSIVHWLTRQFETLTQIQQQTAAGTYSRTVNEILLYIHQNYSDSELTVERIAEHFD